ncbi:MAG: hypothetical protein IH850_11480 [Acidobacteria bacterium]|nr:hypothetical protein [Acidobacteriota bacterium]
MERDSVVTDHNNPLSRGPSGLLRSSKSGKQKAKRMGRALAGVEGANPLSRGPSGLLRSSKSGKNGTASVETTDHPSGHVMRTKRMERDSVVTDHNNPLSRGPSGPLRSSKSGKHRRTAAAGNLQLTTIAAE